MNSLKVPEGGLRLTESGSESNVPPQAFHVQLDKSTIESIIQSSRSGEDVRLSLGSTPSIQYGSKTHRIAPPNDSADYDIYLTRPFESTRQAERIPYTSNVFAKPGRPSRKASTPGLDSDIETLQNGLAAHEAARERARIAKVPEAKASAKSRAKPISDYGSKTASLPTSPSLHDITSPSLNPTLTASQQAMERAKEQRVILVHELAAKDRSTEYLRKKWEGNEHDFRPTLEKVAEHNAASDTWTMRKTYWKELDVWSYNYPSQEERQNAIDNAIRQYDKQRLSSSEAVWQKLLPKEERGRGKCLSRLQASIAMGAPKIKVQKADDGSTSDDGMAADKAKAGGEKMSRSASNPLPTKAKKPTSQEAQVKRLLAPSKGGVAKAKAKAAPPKASPTKAKAGASKGNDRRILSQEIIVNSDDSGDEAPAAPPVAKPKPKPAASKVKDTVIVAGRPPVNAPARPSAPAKRPREEEDSSSSSGTPLSKRIKPRQQALPALKHRPSDASVNSRGTAVSSSFKSKNTSPTKSSPLASSPPTNASDLDNDAPPAPKMKRKADMESKPLAAKRRPAESVSMDIVRKATKFRTYYQQYEALHHEISALDNPPREKLSDLIDMRGRLEALKKEIYRECSPARD